uniref:Phosphofurin acidic cluster sorting protein 1/2 C-terminal domain-containing protein n=1 Tax=Eptatretus burgeri TaxID=7764 RepID=A0A8C4R2A0_EPTBU
MVDISEWQGKYMAARLQTAGHPVICTTSPGDVHVVFSSLITRLQHHCKCNPQPPGAMRVALLGDLPYLHTILCCYVQQMAPRPAEWLTLLHFFIVPFGSHAVSRHLAAVDPRYGSTFLDPMWQEVFSRLEPPHSECADLLDVAGRITAYLEGADSSVQLPIAEAMLTYKARRPLPGRIGNESSPDMDSCQKFVPFIGGVTVGVFEESVTTAGAVDSDDCFLASPAHVGSPYFFASPTFARDAVLVQPSSPPVGSPPPGYVSPLC